MVGNLEGSYYALPLMNDEQKSGLLAIMPPNATQKVEQEAGKCEDQPCDELPDEVRHLEAFLHTFSIHILCLLWIYICSMYCEELFSRALSRSCIP